MLIFLSYRQHSEISYGTSSLGDEKKTNPQQLSRTLMSLRYREPLLSGLVTTVCNNLSSITVNFFQLLSPFPPFNNSLI